LLNLMLSDYCDQRTGPDGGQPLRSLMTELTNGLVGTFAPYPIAAVDGQPAWPVDLTVWKSGAIAYFGLINNAPETTDPPGRDSLFVPRRCRVAIGEKAHLYDVRNGKYLGEDTSATVDVPADEPVVVAAMPYRVDELQLSVPDKIQQGQVLAVAIRVLGTPHVMGHHVLRIALIDPDGHRVDFVNRPIIARLGRETLHIPFALNDRPGQWQIHVADVVTGTAASGTFSVRPHSGLTLPRRPVLD